MSQTRLVSIFELKMESTTSTRLLKTCTHFFNLILSSCVETQY